MMCNKVATRYPKRRTVKKKRDPGKKYKKDSVQMGVVNEE